MATTVQPITPELGPFGIWIPRTQLSPGFAADVERAGFGALWVGLSPRQDLRQVEEQLEASERIPVATGIVNIWGADVGLLAESYHRVQERHPNRLLLGLGAAWAVGKGDPPMTPYRKVVQFLDGLAERGVPREHLVLAALGPRMLRLAAERTAGAHPYLTPPAHTAFAREVLGDGPLLAPEQRVAFEDDLDAARETARASIEYYLGIPDYRRNLGERLGYTERDLSGRGSDRLVDDLSALGGDEAIGISIRAHLAVGADHVCAQLLVDGDDARRRALDRLGGILAPYEDVPDEAEVV
jgi:probable F420-dependent oxidoreductase